MDGREREIPLKAKYAAPKPKGRFRADYNGNTGKHRAKGLKLPMVPGIKRKQHVKKYK